MFQTLIRNWWLLARCGIFEALYAVINLVMPADGTLTLRTYAVKSTITNLGMLAVAAGVCTIVAGLRTSKHKSWLLVLNGLAFGILGLLLRFWTGPLSFRTIAALIVVMALSAGAFELITAFNLRRHQTDEWFLGAAGIASIAFGFIFLLMSLLQIRPKDAETTFLWMGSYFGLSAICMLAVALRLNNLRAAIHRMANQPLPLV